MTREVGRKSRLFRGCDACLEGKLKPPPDPESKHAPLPDVGHTMYADMISCKRPTLGGNSLVLIMKDEKSGGVFHSAAKRMNAQSIEEAAIKAVCG